MSREGKGTEAATEAGRSHPFPWSEAERKIAGGGWFWLATVRPNGAPHVMPVFAAWANTSFFKEGLKRLGFNTGCGESPITPVIAGEAPKAMKLSDRLFEEGVFEQGIGFPTVARDKARVRTIVMATHTREDLQFALDAFAKVGKELGLV